MSMFADIPSAGTGDNFAPKEADGHLLIIESVKPGNPWKSKYPPYEEKASHDVNIVDVTTGDVYRGARVFDGSLVDPLSQVVGKKVAARLNYVQNKDQTGTYPALTTAVGEDMDACKRYMDEHPDPFGQLGGVPAPVQQSGGGLATTGQGTRYPEQAAPTPAPVSPEPAQAGPDPADVVTAKRLIAAEMEDRVILASCPSLTPTVLAALRSAG